jgi:hypothetical protein
MGKQGYYFLNKDTGWTELRRNQKFHFSRLRALKVQRDCESICWICGEEVPIEHRTLDHIVPQYLMLKDGDIHPSHYWISHSGCNNFRGTDSVITTNKCIVKALSNNFPLKPNGINLKRLKNKKKVNKNNSLIEVLKQVNYVEKHSPELLGAKLNHLERLINKRLKKYEKT